METNTTQQSAIYQEITRLYNSEKGKNFVIHLLRSFFPINKSFEVLFQSEKDGKLVELVCCITKQKLNSKDEKISKILSKQDELFKEFLDNAKISLSEQPIEKETKVIDSIKKELVSFNQAIGSEKSDKVLSIEAFQELYNFYCTQLLKGNKHITNVANQERTNRQVEKKESPTTHTLVKKPVIKKESSGFSLGDLDALKQLKSKFND